MMMTSLVKKVVRLGPFPDGGMVFLRVMLFMDFFSTVPDMYFLGDNKQH